MPRIAGTNIPDSKRVDVGLAYIYGVGPTNVKQIMLKAGINSNPKFSELSQEVVDKLRNIIEKEMTTENDLRSQVNQNIRRLKEIGSFRGLRHIRNLPVRGQRTKTNARTKRGKRITVGSGRKKASDKT